MRSAPAAKIESTAKTIALLGTFEVRNYGDHLFPAILRRAIAEFLEGAEVRLFSPSPATDYFDGTAIHAFEDLGRQNPPMDAFVIAGGDIVRFDPYPHPG
ncbi:MAG TPA: hypothetical protein VK961_00320, partial [Chthoniobacter sp.]|nr:hypothetical protein [Chthoniobacter sp.]